MLLSNVIWTLSPQVKGMSIDQDGLLTITPTVEAGTFYIIAKYAEDSNKYGIMKIKTIPAQGRDMPPNPIEKEGWELFAHDEFDAGALNRSIWSEQYLRNWSDDVGSKANYVLEDDKLIVKADSDSDKWSPYDSAEVSSITSFEKAYLHRFGSNKNEFSRIIPTFDGLATKYGYFEIRAKLPNTGDGSHVAWWMIGVQDDQNIFPFIEDQTVTDHRSSNETGEVDVIEISLDNLSLWRPVMHPNGSTALEYLHVPETKLPFDPGNEFHIYGFEWDANGTKYYVDNKLVQETDRTFDYRMMTFLGVYAQGGMGKANNIFPKEFVIGYFRVYKKDAPPVPNDIQFDCKYHAVKKPTASTNTTFSITANVFDQFDQPLENIPLLWQFSESISGEEIKPVPGAAIDRETGNITLTKDIADIADLFVTAKVAANQQVKKVWHLRVSTEPAKPHFMEIQPKQKVIGIKVPEETAIYQMTFQANLIDQYGRIADGSCIWQLADGTALLDVAEFEGVTIDREQGLLEVSSAATAGQYIVVQARTTIQAKDSGDCSLDNEIYGHQLIKLV
ncbi:hypothetical protein GCM10026983_26480 [Gracilibacillus alcaliphilus]